MIARFSQRWMWVVIGFAWGQVLVDGVVVAKADSARPDYIVAVDGSGDFKRVQEAIDSVTTGETKRAVILIKPGIYKEKRNLKLVGESYETTILTYDDQAKETKDDASTRVYAEDFWAENLTFRNTIDSRKGGSQAAALRVDGDRALFYRCRITGFQDTYYTGGNKPYTSKMNSQ